MLKRTKLEKRPMAFIPQMEPWFDEQEARAVYEYMKSGGWVTEFRKTRELEDEIAQYTGARHCSMMPNGTLSLSVALIACGIGPGDEVIVPDYTMVASANAVKLAGAEVIFADISPENLCLDFHEMQRVLSPRTRAVILVTINGRYPADLEEICASCKGRGLIVIEDAAQSLGSFKDGRHLGTFGDIGSFSFSAPKIITTGQRGALVTNDEHLYERMLQLRDFGRESGGSDHYLTIGWNFKFTDVQAVIGIEQMKKLPWRVNRKKEIYELYRKNLEGIEPLSFIPTNLKDTSPWFIDILVQNGQREPLIAFLKERGIGSRPFYPPLHGEPVYARTGSYPVSERISSQGLWLPSSSRLDNDDILWICEEICSFFKNDIHSRN
jgi:perosamine synthetase